MANVVYHAMSSAKNMTYKRCNVAKMDQTYDEFVQLIINIYNNLNLKDYG